MFVTDADGTLLGRHPEFDKYRAFRDQVNNLRTNYGMVWVVCTGRSLRGYLKIFQSMRMFGITPDYVIARHAYIYECKPWGYLPHWFWNFRILWLQWKDNLVLRRAMPMLRDAVLSSNPFAKVVYRNRQRICFRFADESAARFGAEILKKAVLPYRYLQLFESPTEVDIRVIPFTKGLAVTELARHLGVSTSQILVVGDGHNDISMMEMEPPCYTACPSNAAAEVVETVHRTRGHIASQSDLAGVLEVLSAYETGRVNDQLPKDWVGREGPISLPHTSRGIRGGVGSVLLILAIVYTTLVVLGSFVGFPGRSLVLKPYFKMIEQISRIIETVRQ